RSTERWNDVFGEQFDLAHLLVRRHETLVEEPTEPFEFALAADLVKRRDLGLDLVDRSGQRIFDLAHALQGPLAWRQVSEKRGRNEHRAQAEGQPNTTASLACSWPRMVPALRRFRRLPGGSHTRCGASSPGS